MPEKFAVELSIDGGPASTTVMWNAVGEPGSWIAGPLPITVVDVYRDPPHDVEIVSGERAGWTATAGHGRNEENDQEAFLNGREPFAPPDEDANEAAARVVREATEGG